MNNINKLLGNVTSNYYLEPVSRDLALSKIKKACEDLLIEKNINIPFLPELIEFNHVYIMRDKLDFTINWHKLENALNVNYDKDKYMFNLAYQCYSAAKFKIDPKWFDQDNFSCVKLLYCTGLNFITNFNSYDIKSNKHYLNALHSTESLLPLNPVEQVNLIYFN